MNLRCWPAGTRPFIALPVSSSSFSSTFIATAAILMWTFYFQFWVIELSHLSIFFRRSPYGHPPLSRFSSKFAQSTNILSSYMATTHQKIKGVAFSLTRLLYYSISSSGNTRGQRSLSRVETPPTGTVLSTNLR
jgi:hypothetical protein